MRTAPCALVFMVIQLQYVRHNDVVNQLISPFFRARELEISVVYISILNSDMLVVVRWHWLITSFLTLLVWIGLTITFCHFITSNCVSKIFQKDKQKHYLLQSLCVWWMNISWLSYLSVAKTISGQSCLLLFYYIHNYYYY